MRRVRRFDFVGRVHTDRTRLDGVLATVDESTGFVRLQGRIARDGLLEYGDGKDTWMELRPRDELERAFASFALVPITNDHPPEMVNADNVRDYQVGHAGTDVSWDEELPDHARVSMLVTDADSIGDIDSGKAQLSIGFTAEVHETPGIHDGVAYRYVQRAIVGNHIAIVDEGRAGPEARLLTDAAGAAVHRGDRMKIRKATSKRSDDDGTTQTVVLAGEEVEIPTVVVEMLNAQAAEIERLVAKVNEISGHEPPPPEPSGEPAVAPAEPETGETALIPDPIEPIPDVEDPDEDPPAATEPEEDEEEDPMKKTTDNASALRARIDAFEAERKRDKATEAARIDARVRLVTDARMVLGQNAKVDGVSDAVLMRDVVLHVEPELKDKLDANKGDAGYLRASFDHAVEKYRKDHSPHRELGEAIAGAVGDDDFDQYLDSIVKLQDRNDARAAGIRLAEGSN